MINSILNKLTHKKSYTMLVGITVITLTLVIFSAIVQAAFAQESTIKPIPRIQEKVVIKEKVVKQKKMVILELPSNINFIELARTKYGKCGEFYSMAIDAGWKPEQWSKISYIINRESRCQTLAFNKKDPMGGSRGLMQINGFWCSKNRYSKSGYLQDNLILSKCEQLFLPEVNLKAALTIYNYSQNKNNCGWQPWAFRC